MKKRDAFNFYRSYYDVLEDIHRDEDKLTYLLALLDRQFKGIEPTLVGIPKLVYKGQKHSIDKQVEGWESKTKTQLKTNEDPSIPPTQPPYEPPTEGGSQDPYLQEQEQGKGKEEEKVEVQVQKWNSTNQLNSLMTLFGEKPQYKRAIEIEWNQLTVLEQELAFENGERFVEWEDRPNKSLRFYLIDRKWEWDLTPNEKNNTIEETNNWTI